jgi:hypothetical protein
MDSEVSRFSRGLEDDFIGPIVVSFEARSAIMMALASDPVVRHAIELCTWVGAEILLAERDGTTPSINLDKIGNTAGVDVIRCLYPGGTAYGPWSKATTARANSIRIADAAVRAMRGA